MEPHLVSHSDDILSGIPVFYGMRVPVQNLIDYLTTEETISEFLDDFPTGSRRYESSNVLAAPNNKFAILKPLWRKF